MDDQAQELLNALIERLRAEGVPEGTWLVELAAVRAALRDADALLRRIEEAVRRAAESRFRSPGP